MKITIDLEEIKKLSKNGQDIFIKPEAEKELIKLLSIKEQIEEIYNEAKKLLEEKALKINKNFASIEGDQIKISYRSFGSKYFIDKQGEVPVNMINKVVKYSINTKELNTFIKENGKLPLGISEAERKKQISIKIKK